MESTGGIVIAVVSDLPGTQHDEVMLALVAVLGTAVAALIWVIKSYRQVKEVNTAVNNVGPGEHRLYDKITAIQAAVQHLTDVQEEFNAKGWSSLPPDLATAPALTETIRRIQQDHAGAEAKLDQILSELQAHVEWEQTQKYPRE